MTPPAGSEAVAGLGGILLTGGASSRMGRDKASIDFGGRSLAQRIASLLEAVCETSVEAGPGASPLPSVCEDPPRAGPLAAIAAGWQAIAGSCPLGAIVVACDLANLEEAVLRLLAARSAASSCIPVLGGRAQYLCARYCAATLDRAGALVSSGHRSVSVLAAAGPTDLLGMPAWSELVSPRALFDVDTEEDLRLAMQARDWGITSPR